MDIASTGSPPLDGWRTPEHASITTGVLVALPTLVGLSLVTHWSALAFLATVLVGVVVPTTYHSGDRPEATVGSAVRWTATATILAWTTYLGFALGLRAAGLGETTAAIGPFLAVALGGPLLAARLAGRR